MSLADIILAGAVSSCVLYLIGQTIGGRLNKPPRIDRPWRVRWWL